MPKVADSELDDMGARLIAQARESVDEIAPKAVALLRDWLATLKPISDEMLNVEKIIEIAKSLGAKEAVPLKEGGFNDLRREVSNVTNFTSRLIQSMNQVFEHFVKLQNGPKPPTMAEQLQKREPSPFEIATKQ